MGKPVILTGICKCSFGAAPTPLMVIPSNVFISKLPTATIMDFVPFLNIIPFGVCRNLANPTVLAATIAHFGILTPMPCIPIVTSPWTPVNPLVTVQNKPMLVNSAMNNCIWSGGIITVTFPGVSLVTV